jgi:hypothetical protein
MLGGIESILWVLGILGACLGVIGVLVVLAVRDEVLDPDGAKAYAIDMLNDKEFGKECEEADKDGDGTSKE